MASTAINGGRVAVGEAAVGGAVVVPVVRAGTKAFVSMIKFLRLLQP